MNKFSAIDPLHPLTQQQFDKAKAAWANRDAARRQAAADGSTGPVTPEGKAISAQNARKHGFAGAKMVIDEEDQTAYDAHLDSYRDSFAPGNQVESDTVRLAANAMWRVDRLTSIETGLIELEMAHNAPQIDAFLEKRTPVWRGI